MDNHVKIEATKISNGWVSESEEMGLTYFPKSEVFIDELRNELRSVDFDSIPNGSKVAFEFLVHNLNEEPSTKELYDQVVVKEPAYNPVKKQEEVDENKFRLSINANNCMPAAELQKIDWDQFISDSGLTYKRMAEIAGTSESTVYQMFYSIRKGKKAWNFTATRIRLTIIYKFVGLKNGAKATLCEEIVSLKEALANEVDQLFALKDIEGNYLRMKNARPILDRIRELVK